MKICYFGSYDKGYSRNRIIMKGLKKHKISIVESNATGPIIIRYFRLVKQFVKKHKKCPAIIVGFPGWYDVPLAFVLAKIFGKKLFFDIFVSTYETYVVDRKLVSKKSLHARFYYLLDRIGLQLADFVIVDSSAHGKYYNELYGLNTQKQIKLYVGSDTDYFFPRHVNETTDVLFYGSYQPLQGIDIIIRAAKKLPKIKFKMIGDGEMKREAQNLSKKLKTKNVEFIGWMPLISLAEEIAKARLTLGIFGTSKKANAVIPNKVYDYLASAKAVVTADTDAARELLTNNKTALLVPAGNSNALALVINRIIKNHEDREKLAKNGFEFFTRNLKTELIVNNLIVEFEKNTIKHLV